MALAFLLDLDLPRSLSRQRVFRDRLNAIDVYNSYDPDEFIAIDHKTIAILSQYILNYTYIIITS